MLPNKRKVGTRYELIARKFLEHNGLECLEQNYYCKLGEIDGIYKDGEVIVFVEVKYRYNSKLGDPTEAVNYHKQVQISKCAKSYIMTHRLGLERPYRFDVVAFKGNKVKWIKDAFEYAWK